MAIEQQPLPAQRADQSPASPRRCDARLLVHETAREGVGGVSRFADARANGTYSSGDRGVGRNSSPAELTARMSAYGGGMRSGADGQPQPPALLYDSDGKPLPFEAFRSSIDGGPGTPLQPRFTDSSRPPRESQFTPGWNLIPTPRSEGGMVRFPELRALAMACWQFRVAVNYRKKQMRGLRWEIAPKEAKTPTAKKKYQTDIDRVKAFFSKPNPIDNLRFGEWVGQAIEEMLTVDATVFFKYPTKDGKSLHALVQIDGATIKQLIDEFGHVVGYQQILYGYPATQYPTYDPATKSAVVRDSDELLGRISYIVMNPSVDSVYGTSTLEQLRPTIDIAIRRTARQLAWYQDGTVPDSFIEAPDGWIPEQITAMQRIYNELYSGNEILRSQMTLLPHGANYTPTKAFAYSKEESEEIVSIICASEGLPRSIFTSQTNKATSEMQRDEAQDTGFTPIKMVFKDFLDDIIENDLGAPDLEANPVDTVSGSEWELAQAKSLSCGAKAWRTVDEIRAEGGEDPMPEEALPVVMAPGAVGPDGKPVAAPVAPPRAKVAPKAPPADEAAQKADLGAWERFARKRLEKGKQSASFVSTALPGDVTDLVVRGLAAAGTDTQIRAVFVEARETIEKRKRKTMHARALERDFAASLARGFADQKRSLLVRAKDTLPAEAAA